MLDGLEFGKEVVDLVRGYVEREIAPLKTENESLRSRVALLEERQPEKGDPGERGIDGVSPEIGEIAETFRPIADELIAEAVAKAVSALPPPERGDKGDPGERGEKGDPGNNGADGRDGAGIVDGFLSREGHLIATLSDGTTRDFGEVVGKDGRDGKDGDPGRDGIDLDSFDAVVLSDDRTIELKFVSGEMERVASFKWPVPIDCGVYKSGEQYQRGDMVTWGGSLWLAQRDTDAKPDTPESGWRLAVKRGRDGKDAK